MKPTGISFEKRYSDDSGVEFGVYLVDGKTLRFRSQGGDTVEFPAEQLEWIMDALELLHDLQQSE